MKDNLTLLGINPLLYLQAKASVQADADAIKEHIKKKHKCFEYVNQTVEHALWCEVIEYVERSKSSKISSRPSQESTTVGPSTLTESEDSRRSSGLSAHGQCNLQ